MPLSFPCFFTGFSPPWNTHFVSFLSFISFLAIKLLLVALVLWVEENKSPSLLLSKLSECWKYLIKHCCCDLGVTGAQKDQTGQGQNSLLTVNTVCGSEMNSANCWRYFHYRILEVEFIHVTRIKGWLFLMWVSTGELWRAVFSLVLWLLSARKK